MRNTSKLIVASAALALAAQVASADITIDKNGFYDLNNGSISGALIGSVNLGTDPALINLGSLQPLSTYTLSFGTGRTLSNNFTFTTGVTGDEIASVGTNGAGHQMATVVGTNTLKFNTQNVTYNVGGRQTGNYYINGTSQPYNFSPPNGIPLSVAVTRPFLPGSVSIDNLYNSGAGNEDFEWIVDGNGNTSPSPANHQTYDGVNFHPAPAHSEYAQFNNLSITVNTIKVLYHIESEGPLTYSYYPYNFTINDYSAVQTGPNSYVYDFSIDQPVGNAGQLFAGLHDWTVTGGTLLNGYNLSPIGQSAAYDYTFAPQVRYSGGMYYLNTTGGYSDVVTQTLTALNFDYTTDGTIPRQVSITATLVPEPASLGMLALGGVLLLRRRRMA